MLERFRLLATGLILLPTTLHSLAVTAPLHSDLSAPSFSRLARAGIRTGRLVDLRGRTFSLRREFVMPAGATLTIRGGKIVGDGHTLFKLPRNRAQLILEDCELHHFASPDRQLRRELGGGIFALGKSHVRLQNFGLWLVQRAHVVLSNCRISQCGRSGVVCFGHARLDLAHTAIDGAQLHGICMRGDTHVSLVDCVVSNSGVRGIYAYHNATLILQRTSVMGTRDPTAAAIQIEAFRQEDRATLHMDGACVLRDNMGEGLRISGSVDVSHLPL